MLSFLKSLFSTAKSPEVKTEAKTQAVTPSVPQKVTKPKSTARIATVKKKANGSNKK